MSVCRNKHEKLRKYGKKRISSTSFRLGLTVTDNIRLASLAEKNAATENCD